MQESRKKESEKRTEKGIKQRQSEATSKKTLADLEDSEKISNAKKSAEVPSPDGQVDDPDESSRRETLPTS